MNEIKLTQEELDLIQAKRDEELAKEQRKQEKIAEDIKRAQYNVAKRLEEYTGQRVAARAFKKELGEGWMEETISNDWTEKVY